MKIILMFGKPGSGKDTQMKLLADQTGIKTINIGEIIRDNITSLTPEERQKVDSGELLSDETIIKLLNSELSKNQQEQIILNGYPRTLTQAQKLSQENYDIYIFDLKTSDKVVKERLKLRAVKESRTDDNEGAIMTRLSEYHHKTEPILEHFSKNKNYFLLNGEAEIDQINAQIKQIYDQHIK